MNSTRTSRPRVLWALLFTTALAISGCDAGRAMTDSESRGDYRITHSLAKAEAFNRTEVWLAETFVSAKAVIDVKQPDTGIIIGKGRTTIRSAQPGIMAPIQMDVALRINNADRLTELRCVMQSPYGSGVELTAPQRADVRSTCDLLAEGLAKSLGGQLAPSAVETAALPASNLPPR